MVKIRVENDYLNLERLLSYACISYTIDPRRRSTYRSFKIDLLRAICESDPFANGSDPIMNSQMGCPFAKMRDTSVNVKTLQSK